MAGPSFKVYLCACAVVLSMFAPASSTPFPIAVGGDDKCTNPNIEPVLPDYPETMNVMMDSFHFKDLLEIEGGEWPSIGSWQDGFGGICRRITWGCSAIFGSDPNGNHVFTEYIPLSGANKVFIEVTHAAVCTRYPCPQPQIATVSVYESSGRNNVLGKRDGDHFVSVGSVSSRKQSEETTLFTITPGANTNGIYLKFSEEDDCITINRLIVYAESCNEKIESLLYYPSTFSPDDSVEYTSATGECLINSSVATPNGRRTVTPTVECAAAGVWRSSSGCECDPGHYYSGRDCKSCQPGTYKHDYGNARSCYECPENSDSTEFALTECSCNGGFYRVRGEPATTKCTTVPSSPKDFEVEECKNSSVRVAWSPPDSLGGRDDTYYKIYYQETVMMHFGMIEVTSTTGLSAQVTGLKPVTDYTIRVVARNGASDVHGDDMKSSADVAEKTKEGVPEEIDVFGRRRGNTFSWQPPRVINGELTGFDVQIVCHLGDSATVTETLALDPMEFCFSPVDLPHPCDSVTVQVRAKTKIGAGKWSVPIETLPSTNTPTSATTATTATAATTMETFATIKSTPPTSSSSSCPSGIPPCDFDTCRNVPHQICVIDETGCGGSCQVSSCRVCTAGEEFTAAGCESSQCDDEYDDACIKSWGQCVKRENRDNFVRPTAALSINCVPHPCM